MNQFYIEEAFLGKTVRVVEMQPINKYTLFWYICKHADPSRISDVRLMERHPEGDLIRKERHI